MRIEELRKEIEELCGNCDRPDKEELGKIILSSMTLGFNEGLKASSANKPQGEWIDNGDRYFRCSLCGTKDTDKWHWCHGCGAKMKGADDE